jgi:hypothetical protein
MERKTLSILAVILALCFFCSCSSPPEQQLLNRYFSALSLNDNTTLSTIALDPVDMPSENWEILNVNEEIVEPFRLSEMNKQELDFKKQLEDHVGETIDARDAWDDAVYEEERARTTAAKRAAKAKADELKVKYDEVYEEHKELQRKYNEAKAAAAEEEKIATFSLGTGELPTIRDFTGEVHRKEVDVKTEGEAGVKNYRIYLRRYILQDEATGMHNRGRWIITKFEGLN